MRYSFIFIAILLLSPSSLFCQNIFGDSSRPKHVIVGLGSSFSEWATGEVSAMLSEGTWVGPCVPNYGYCGPRASVEFSTSPQGSLLIA
ncbi:MAG: hypothetical protein Q8919_09540, partial [Bacteroidota bacterium]|nr:hypothetical protein [Bacteroidota bacterium]